MMRFTKKGISPIGLLGEMIIVLAVIIIILAIVLVPRFFQQSEIVGEQIGGIQGDADKDGIRNFFDQCPCTFGDSIYDGCPATFTGEQKQEDVKKYNSKPSCGIVAEEVIVKVGTNTAVERVDEEKTTEPESEAAAFKHYRSIEIFGGDDYSPSPESGAIRQACTGRVGKDCPSEDNDCDGNFYFEDVKEGCWVMASEDDDTDPNDCGQSIVDDGAVFPLEGYMVFSTGVFSNYQSKTNEEEPANLFYWKWKSKPDYGSLLCNKGFWYGCKEANEGRELSELVNGQKYKCTGGEWVKQ